MKTENTRLDNLKVGDKVLVNTDEVREVTFIRNGMMGINWHSIYLSTPEGKTSGHLIGHEHHLCDKII